MKKRGIIIVVTLFLIVVIVGTCYLIKGEWKEAMSTFGPLNIMVTDDMGTISENCSTSSFLLSSKNDFYLSGNIRINKGNVSCIITCNGDKIYENFFGEGDHQINTDIFRDKGGEICIEIIASDDVDGDYNIAIYTRERILYHFIRKLYLYI